MTDQKPPLPSGGLLLPGGSQQAQQLQVTAPGLEMRVILPLPTNNVEQQLDAIAKVLINIMSILAHDRADRKALTVQVNEATKAQAPHVNLRDLNTHRGPNPKRG